MSAVGIDVHNALGPLLAALPSPDNAIRSQAEAELQKDWVAARPEVLLMGLVEQMAESTDQTVGFHPPAIRLGLHAWRDGCEECH